MARLKIDLAQALRVRLGGFAEDLRWSGYNNRATVQPEDNSSKCEQT
jgi:hypothetical protein